MRNHSSCNHSFELDCAGGEIDRHQLNDDNRLRTLPHLNDLRFDLSVEASYLHKAVSSDGLRVSKSVGC